MNLNLEIISPQEIFYNQEVDLVIFPGIEGDFGILKSHMPLLTYLRLGIIYVYKQRKIINSFLVNGGIVEVLDNKCTLLTEDITESKDFKLQQTDSTLEKLKSELTKNLYYK
tara:strand:- start:282 stop:617 length:336 start_codon:yes stop_codon:yes gene_type:complete